MRATLPAAEISTSSLHCKNCLHMSWKPLQAAEYSLLCHSQCIATIADQGRTHDIADNFLLPMFEVSQRRKIMSMH